MNWLLDPLAYEFIRNALLAGVLTGILCPVVGTYLIVQRLSLLGNVLSHSVLPGLALAHFLGWDLLIGAFVFGVLSTALITWVKAQSRIKADAIMALTLAAFFALGVALLTILRSTLDLESLLFGDLLSVTQADLWQMGLIAAALLGLVKLFYKELLLFTFDRLGAEAMGLPVTLLNWGLTAAVTLTIVIGMKAVGVILVIALMVGPALTAYLLVKELHWMMILGAAIGAIASVVGIYLSYYLDIPSGPTIALSVFVLFVLALLISPSQGVLTRRWSQ
jgi:manganese/iron transport system permease protein